MKSLLTKTKTKTKIKIKIKIKTKTNSKALLIFLLCLSLPVFSNDANIAVGKKLTSLSVDNKGEIILNADKISYQAWSTDSMNGKVQVFQYLAARLGIDEINKPFTDALELQTFAADKFAVTTLINVDDALWGTSGLINSELKRNKIKHPTAVMVADQQGLGLKQWGLKKKGAAIAIIDKAGTVLFFKEGALSNEEIKANLALIEKHL